MEGRSEPLDAISMIRIKVIEQFSRNCPLCSKNDQNGPQGVPLRAPRVPLERFNGVQLVMAHSRHAIEAICVRRKKVIK